MNELSDQDEKAQCRRNRLMLDAIPEGIYGIDDQGLIGYINPAAREMLGWSEQEALGCSEHALFHHSHPDGSLYPGEDCPILLAQGRADDIREMICVLWRRDGTPLPVELSVTAMPEMVSGIAKLVVFHEISQLKENQQNLLQTVNELSQLSVQLKHVHSDQLRAEKMQAISQMAAGIAHEINNPIGYIHSNLSSLEKYVQALLSLLARYEVLEQTGAIAATDLAEIREAKQVLDLPYLREDLADLLTESRQGMDRVRRVVQDLKAFSREGCQDARDWIDLPPCIDNVLGVIRGEIERKCILKKEYGNTPEIYCVPAQIGQVLMHLLVNALQAIEPGGEIAIRTGADDKTVWVEIADNGVGIAAENLSKIFDPFFSTKTVGKGSGMGLAIAYGIVSQHGGWIDVTSTPGQGSTFLVVLPIEAHAAAS